MSTSQHRVAAGVREGGQFSTRARPEAAVALHGEIPTTIPELWDHATREANRIAGGRDTENRELAWSRIVRSVNPAWDVGLGEQRRILEDEAQRRARPDRLGRYESAPQVRQAVQEIDALVEAYRGKGEARISEHLGFTAMLADLHLWSIQHDRLDDRCSTDSRVADELSAAHRLVLHDVSALRDGPVPAVDLQVPATGPRNPDASRAETLLTTYSTDGRASNESLRRLMADLWRWRKVSGMPLVRSSKDAEVLAHDQDLVNCQAAVDASY